MKATAFDVDESLPLVDQTARKADEEKVSHTSLDLDGSFSESAFTSLLWRYARTGKTDNLREIIDRFPALIHAGDRPEQNTALHYAVRYGRVDTVKYLLYKGADVEAKNVDDQTPLHMAAKYLHGESSFYSTEDAYKHSTTKLIIDELIRRRSDVNAEESFNMRPLHLAAMKNNEVAVKALLEAGADINAEDKNHLTPLLTACIHRRDANSNYYVVKWLIDYGADLSKSDKRNNNVFHVSAFYGNIHIIEHFLRVIQEKIHVDPRMKVLRESIFRQNKEGKTPLRMAVEGEHPKTVNRILQEYKEQARDFMLVDSDLLHFAANKGFLQVVQKLVDNGYRADSQNYEINRLPIHNAARSNYPDVVEYLAKQDYSNLLVRSKEKAIDEADAMGCTPLMLAATSNAYDSANKLIELGADVWETDNEGRSAVFIGAKYNATNVVKRIMEAVKDETLKDLEGPRVRRRGLRAESPKSAEEIVREKEREMVNGANAYGDTPIHAVSSIGYIEMMRLLYSYGADITLTNEDEEIPLHKAALQGATPAVRLLLEWNKTLILNKDYMGNSALHLAARSNRDVTVSVLITNGADIEARNVTEQTPLMCAVQEGGLDAVEQLVTRGAKVTATEGGTVSLLHMAAEKGYHEIVTLLLRQDPEIINIRNADKNTALDIALEYGKKDVARVLLENDRTTSLMKPTDAQPIGRHSEVRKTPFRRLVVKFPDLAEIVLDKCQRLRNDPQQTMFVVREYDFQYLDDTYMMPLSKGSNILSSEESPYDDNGKLKSEAVSYTEAYDVITKNHLLKIMVNNELMKLLAHPVTINLIKYKWNKLGRYIYYLALTIYIIFISLFTAFIAYSPAPYNVPMRNKTEGYKDLSPHLWGISAACPKVEAPDHDRLLVIKWLVVVLAVGQLCKEAFQLFKRRFAYLTTENGVECFVYVSTIFIVFDISECSDRTGIRMNIQWLLAAVTAFIAWLNLLLLIRKLPRFGIYVVMLFDILSTFLRFTVVFALFILAFSISFFIMMQNRSEFATIPDSILKTTVMMIGEFEFTAIFHGDTMLQSERLFGPPWAKAIFLLFCVVMTILLMNLLVGLAVDDIKSVQEKAELQRLAMQVELVLQIEASMFPFIRRLSHIGVHRFYPNKEISWWKRLGRMLGYEPSSQTTDIDEYAMEDDHAEIHHELQTQKKAIDQLQNNIDVMYEKQTKIEHMLQALLNKLDIKFEEND